MWPSLNNKTTIPEPRHCLPGRAVPLELPGTHYVNGRTLAGPYPDGAERAIFAMGCFWGAERLFWSKPGVLVTAVGYAGGTSLNPLYDEVCSGKTGHAEAVLVVFDPKQVEYTRLLAAFWESHNPTQGMRQGHDIGTQYRSAIFATSAEQQNIADGMRAFYQKKLTAAGFGTITTTISGEVPFYFAENDHQQYLAKNPNGYCGLGGTGVTCPLS